MKKYLISLCLGIILAPSGQSLTAAPVPYSGKVAINGLNFQGDAPFTFALRDANGTVHWRNGADADSSVTLNVDRGLYVCLLGGNEMNDFPPSLFLENPELFLVVHFFRPDIGEWLHLQPDQLITSAPHALAAEVARNALTADAVKPGAITKSMLAADVLADLNATVVLPEQNATIQTGSITRSMLAPGVLSDLNATIAPGSITAGQLAPALLADLNRSVVITRSMLPASVLADLNRTLSRTDLPADVLADLNRTIVITRDMLPGDVLDDLNKTITRGDLPASVLSDLNRTITKSQLGNDVLADLNATISRSRLAADVLADLNHTIGTDSITLDKLSPQVRADLNASIPAASVTAAKMHPDLIKYFLPEITSSPVGSTILQGTGTTLAAGATGKFLNYQWLRNGANLPGETNATLVIAEVNATVHDANYTLVVSNDWGSVTTVAARLAVATAQPVITLLGDANVTVEAATSYADAGATAQDALDGNLTAAILLAGTVELNATGVRLLRYNVADAGGTAAVEKVRTVTVADTTAPVVTLLGDANATHAKDTAWVEPGATASDTLDGNLTNQVAITGAVDVNSTGAYVLTYSVSDGAGNDSNVTRVVNVITVEPWNFTNAGAAGRTGPTQTQVDAAYAGDLLEGKVTINTQGIQEWVVPHSGTYRIESRGAQGGSVLSEWTGGKGALMAGDFNLTKGEMLKILVGQKGSDAKFGHNGSGGNGGGGGTFVVRATNNTPLVIAGGGGGAGGVHGGQHNASRHGGGGMTSVNGSNGEGHAPSNDFGSGGVNQQGGGGKDAAGGAGWLSNGGNNTRTSSPDTYGGVRFMAGGLGGDVEPLILSGGGNIGGFGGGGAARVCGGGGGGYSGGGAGGDSPRTTPGGGGGSYNAGTNQDNTAGTNAGHGKVTIIWVVD
jgi:hypothetical protein